GTGNREQGIIVEQASCLWCHGHLGGTGILPVVSWTSWWNRHLACGVMDILVESAPLQRSDAPIPYSLLFM
ncbi:MAG: hypothetical protein F6K26_55595, partial [Moorea sp. SIO2I5]|nr:hypothetical protein [Moorena sp. SIO2I5]